MNISMKNEFAKKLLINLEKVIIGKTQVFELRKCFSQSNNRNNSIRGWC